MRRLLLAACLLSIATPALAGGVNLAWGERCWPDNPIDWRSFACDTNGGIEQLTGSFRLYADLQGFFGIEAIVDLWSPGTLLPDWWQLWNPGACRESSLTATWDFSTSPPGRCPSPWQGQVVGGIGAYQTALFPPPTGIVSAPYRGRIKLAFVMPTDRTTLSRTLEYRAFRLAIDHQRTVGDSPCTGCAAGVCLQLSQIMVLGDSYMAISAPAVNRLLEWNGPAMCLGDPVRNTTWGRVKSLYR